MIRKTDKKILKDFEESYKCNVKIEDILSKTDYFETSNDVQYYKHKQFKLKLKFAYSIVMTLILMASIGTVGLLGYNSYLSRIDYTQSSNHTPYQLTDEEIEIMEQQCIRINNEPVVSIKLEVDKYIYIYVGVNKDEIIYFYKFHSLNNRVLNYTLKIENNLIIINDNNSFGILYVTINDDNIHYNNLNFIISDLNLEREFNLNILNPNVLE